MEALGLSLGSFSSKRGRSDAEEEDRHDLTLPSPCLCSAIKLPDNDYPLWDRCAACFASPSAEQITALRPHQTC